MQRSSAVGRKTCAPFNESGARRAGHGLLGNDQITQWPRLSTPHGTNITSVALIVGVDVAVGEIHAPRAGGIVHIGGPVPRRGRIREISSTVRLKLNLICITVYPDSQLFRYRYRVWGYHRGNYDHLGSLAIMMLFIETDLSLENAHIGFTH